MAFMDLLKKATKPAAAPSGPTPAERERNLQALLMGIDLLNPVNRLSPEKIRELNIDGVIRYVCQSLKYPPVEHSCLDALDHSISFIVTALEQALRDGLVLTAEWACTSLVHAASLLLQEITFIDQEEAIWKSRISYVQNLELMVRCCIEHDLLAAELAKQQQRRQRKQEELDERKNSYKQRLNSGELDTVIAEIQRNAHSPAKLSPAAADLVREVNYISGRSDDVKAMEMSIVAKQNDLDNILARYHLVRIILDTPPIGQQQEEDDRISASLRCEQKRLAKLNFMLNNLDRSWNKLSASKRQELNIAGILKCASSELKYPQLPEDDLMKLDQCMESVISALDLALRDGLEMTAEWACGVLPFMVRSLRTDYLDKEHEDEVWEARIQCFQNFVFNRNPCIRYDRKTNAIAENQERRRNMAELLDQRKRDFEQLRDTDPRSTAAAHLRDMQQHIGQMEKNIEQMDLLLTAMQRSLDIEAASIQSLRDLLATLPATSSV